VVLVEFGFDLENLYLRVDGTRPMDELLRAGMAITVRMLKPAGLRVGVQFRRTIEARLQVRSGTDDWRDADCPGLTAAAGQVLELRIPFAALGARTSDPVALFVVLTRGATELEHHPRHQPIEFEVPDARFAARNWTA
jgi:hypothetical protein